MKNIKSNNRINTSLIIKKLRDIGLTSYEAKGYFSLLERDTLTVSEVSQVAGIPRTNAYEALEKLMAKGMCIAKPGKTKKYSASDPLFLKEIFLNEAVQIKEANLKNLNKKRMEISDKYDNAANEQLADYNNKEKVILEKYEAIKKIELEKLEQKKKELLEKYEEAQKTELTKLKQKQQKMTAKKEALRAAEIAKLEKNEKEISNEKRDMAEDIHDLVKELTPMYKDSRNNNNPFDYIEVIKNHEQIHRKFIELINKAEIEVLAFTKPPLAWGTEEQMREQVKAQLAAFDRNVILRNVVQMPSDELIKTYSKNGLMFPDKAIKGRKRDQHSKFVDELPAKLFVFDGKVCFFALEDPIKMKTSLTMLVAEHEAMAKSFKLLFETVWEKANDYFIFDNKKYYIYEPEEELKNKVK